MAAPGLITGGIGPSSTIPLFLLNGLSASPTVVLEAATVYDAGTVERCSVVEDDVTVAQLVTLTAQRGAKNG